MTDDRPIIVFDALCVLCSANARFIIAHDRAARFRLAALQSEIGAALYRRFGMDPADPESFLLVEGNRMRRDSDAAIAVYSRLGGAWRLVSVARFVPRFVRDGVYRWVARHRYGLFGRRDACWRPTADLRDRML